MAARPAVPGLSGGVRRTPGRTSDLHLLPITSALRRAGHVALGILKPGGGGRLVMGVSRKGQAGRPVAGVAGSTRRAGFARPRSVSMTMTCWTEPALLFVEVADDGVWRIPIGPANGHGHGVHMMRSLVDEVQIRHNRHGTRVLLRCRTTTATPQHSHRGTPADPELAGHPHNTDARPRHGDG